MTDLPKLSEEAKRKIRQAESTAYKSVLSFSTESLDEALNALDEYQIEVFDARAQAYWELIAHDKFEEFCKE